MVEMDIADEAKLGRPVVEFRHGHVIAETVPRPGDLPRARRDFDFGPQDFLVVVVAGQEHHAVFAKGDRLMILIGGYVFDAENWHCRPIIMDAPASSIAPSGYRQFTSLGSNMHFLGQIPDQTCPGRTHTDFGLRGREPMTEAAKILLAADEPAPVTVSRAEGASPFLLVADHAGNIMPRALGRLGVSEADCQRHIAWDIGIAGLGGLLADALDATLI